LLTRAKRGGKEHKVQRQLVVGNWKMNGGLAQNSALLAGILEALQGSGRCERDVAVCVPFPYLAQVQSLLRETAVAWGAQDVSRYAAGAFTGEVSGAMLEEFGSRYVIVGHSERRHGLGETSETVASKCAAVLAKDMTPIVCVGETLAERESGSTAPVVMAQMEAVLSVVGGNAARMVLAYEPVWAIGTGRTATPEQAQEVHALLRARLKSAGAGDIRLLYGGSVKADNAEQLFAMPDIDGGLIGGASLKAAEFVAICKA
jgi:triosephosphate isomerase